MCPLWQVEQTKRTLNKRKKGNLVENKNGNRGTVDVDTNGNATNGVHYVVEKPRKSYGWTMLKKSRE